MLASDLALALDPALTLQRQGLTPDPWQTDVLRSTAQQTLLLCTRQAGKSTTTAALATHTAVYEPGSLVLIGSPSLRQSVELFRKMKQCYQSLGSVPSIVKDNQTSLELANGSRIEALPENETTIRGFSNVRLLLIDEAARVADPYYFAIRPVLAVSGGRLVALSTPYGQRGWFWQEWQSGGAEWQRVRITAYDCPRISRQFLEEERRALGERWFNQEYLCSFEDSVAQIFSSASIFGAVSSEVAPLFGSPMGESKRSTDGPVPLWS